MNHKYGVAIIGCGLIGKKRANALNNLTSLIICSDLDIQKAKSAAALSNNDVLTTTKWQEAVTHPNVDIVIVATTNNLLSEITIEALKRDKYVLVEKPAACNLHEIDEVIKTMEKSKAFVRVGFNHRYHPALLKANEIIEKGDLGKLMFIRGRYGHGGRVGYETEWRADPTIAGGGELIDQGIHLIDLSNQFLGDFTNIQAEINTFFWKMPVEDNAFMILKTKAEQIAFLHVSCTEWKNLFSFEIYGEYGKLHINGLGGSYGTESIAFYQMLPEMGPPETTIWEFPMQDNSWKIEFEEFLEDISMNRHPKANLYDAKKSIEIIENIYAQSKYDYHSKST